MHLSTVYEWVFWISSFLVIYPYIVYPLILVVLNRIIPRRIGRVDNAIDSNSDLKVTLIVSAFNEERSIRQKLENALQTEYPPQLIEVIVVSDGSTDKTDSIVSDFAKSHSNIKLIKIPDQSGKTHGLNVAVPQASGEVVVFSDANAMYQPDAIGRLVAAFNDPEIGYAVGSALYHDEDVEAVNVSEGLYWKYELWIKSLESIFYSVVGGDGAIYAIRKPLFRELSSIDISDFVNPLQIIAAGHAGVFLSEARSYEGGASNFHEEFKRKRRIVNRSWGAVVRHMHIFSPKSHGKFLFMLFSHKVIRWWSGILVLFAMFSSLMLSWMSGSGFYLTMFVSIFLTIVIALAGWHCDRRDLPMPKLVYLLYYFYLVSIAGSLGILDYIKGTNYATWTHGRNA